MENTHLYSEPAVLLHVADQIATITLNRAESYNSFTRAMHEELQDCMDRIETNSAIKAVIITGAGKAFCAGQNLNERARDFEQGITPDLADSLNRYYNPLIERITSLALPVIAAVNGIAAGGGAGLTLACDIILLTEKSKFQFAFSKVGLGMDCGSSWFLPRMAGRTNALALALTADIIDADRALSLGLGWKKVPPEQLLEEAGTLAKLLAERPPEALTAIKRAINLASTTSLQGALTIERDEQAHLGQTHNYKEAVMAFTNKRTPKFI